MAASAATFVGLVSGVETASANNFNSIIGNMETSISGIPGLISGVSYMMGILLGVLGVLKIKDHVENPGNTPLQQGAIRLAAGGGLFALPIVYEAMQNTIGNNGALVTAPQVKAITLDVQ
jgi:hypothetical protein